MTFTKTLIPSSILRGLQAFFAIIVLGLSVELIKGHAPDARYQLPSVPKLLLFTAGVGSLTLLGACMGFVLACTEFLRGYFEVVIDIVVLLANLVGGLLVAIRLQGKNCADTSNKNRYGKGNYPYKGSLGGIDILNGGCTEDAGCWYVNHESKGAQLNARCKKNQADSVFMFLTVVVLFMVLALTYMRMKRG